jgi:alanine racemase
MTGSVARAEIVVDVAAIRHNVDRLRVLTGVDVMAVVKADGYGHGMVEAARAAREGGATWLGVATLDEALALRAAGDTGRVLFWLTVPGEDYAPAVAAGIDITVASVAALEEVVAASGEQVARVQIKVDTGLHRNGAPPDHWAELMGSAAAYGASGRIEVTGLWSHLACSDAPDHPANDEQEAAFRRALDLAESVGLRPGTRHLANSAAAVLRPSARFDLVRAGIAIYGLDPAPGLTRELDLRPAMTVRARLASLKRVAAGGGVSYGHTWTAGEATHVGLVPLGYGEGLPRLGGNRAEAWVAGARRPVRGRICMDQFIVDLGDLNGAEETGRIMVGDEVVVFGPGALGEPTAQDWAEACETINYEIVTRIGGRLRRRYVDSDQTDSDQTDSDQTSREQR